MAWGFDFPSCLVGFIGPTFYKYDPIDPIGKSTYKMPALFLYGLINSLGHIRGSDGYGLINP